MKKESEAAATKAVKAIADAVAEALSDKENFAGVNPDDREKYMKDLPSKIINESYGQYRGNASSEVRSKASSAVVVAMVDAVGQLLHHGRAQADVSRWASSSNFNKYGFNSRSSLMDRTSTNLSDRGVNGAGR